MKIVLVFRCALRFIKERLITELFDHHVCVDSLQRIAFLEKSKWKILELKQLLL